MPTKYIAIGFAALAIVAILMLSLRASINHAYERGVADQIAVAEKAYREQLQVAIEQAEQDWIAANKHIKTVVKTETRIKEVARDVVKTVTVTDCADLGNDWLLNYNAVIAADSNNPGVGQSVVRETPAGARF